MLAVSKRIWAVLIVLVGITLESPVDDHGIIGGWMWWLVVMGSSLC